MQRIQAGLTIALLVAAFATAGCNEDSTNTQVGQKAESRTPVSRNVSVDIPAGTSVIVALESPIATDENQSGETFRARTQDPIIVGGRTLVPAGAQVHGTLHDVQASGRIKGRAAMTLSFDRIEDAQGVPHAISAQSITLQADSGTKGDIEKIAAGGVLGAIVGGITGGGKGAAIGAGAGAGAGAIVMLATKGDDVELPAGQKLNVYMTSATSIVLART
jgi:outer membrane lipoprotein SlyB